ncbi:endothelin-1-like isoform X1 [Stegostoma tigrinum]|uniref:endothelin-1-like isoform X1 n=1 Tax=Stegostoma tigrinum TaxID=3053191 RepID=UPI0028704557|nr:endothelin-1-like isoform X1 [Stegostoma tigrinum]
MWTLAVVFLIGAFPGAGIYGGEPSNSARGMEVDLRAPFHSGINAALVRPRARVKRCTCYSYKDKECVYYCHLDVIWMNTPERIVPYGLTNVQRHKRSDKVETSVSLMVPRARCICTVETDWQCSQFCQQNERCRGRKFCGFSDLDGSE